MRHVKAINGGKNMIFFAITEKEVVVLEYIDATITAKVAKTTKNRVDLQLWQFLIPLYHTMLQ